MLERLRLQEVEEIIFSVPKGMSVPGLGLQEGEPIMVIKEPGTSRLLFSTSTKQNRDKGFISASGLTTSLDFTINEGSVLYAVWSYIYGTLNTKASTTLRGTEYLHSNGKLITLSTTPKDVILYQNVNGSFIKLIPNKDYTIDDNYITLTQENNWDYFYVSYSYEVENVPITTVKQIHNNIFCAIDIYMKATDVMTDEKHNVCIHCDKVQIFTDFELRTNNSQSASFTPIEVHSVSEGDFNKIVATIVVI